MLHAADRRGEAPRLERPELSSSQEVTSTHLRRFERVVQAELHSQLELAAVVRRWLGLRR